MNALGALVTVAALWWAAFHPDGQTPGSPPPPDPHCTITQRSDGPVDQHQLEMQRKLAEALCAATGAISDGDGAPPIDDPGTEELSDNA